jgi:nucleoside-diphosphate-sugar epimerase
MVGTCLVVGATGSLGSALVRRLEGEDLRVLVRSEEAFGERFGDMKVDIYEGDLSNEEDIDRAIDDVDTVFHCAGVPYFHWGDLVGHTRRLITAAEEEVKVVDIVFPANVLVYGDVGGGTVNEDQAHEPDTRKGMIRENLERQLREANTRGECRTTVLRFPDLYGPEVESRGQMRIFPEVVEGRTVTWPGDLEAEREFIFVDDAAEAMVRLAESNVAWGKSWNVPGPEITTAKKFIEMAFQMAGHEPDIKVVGKGSMHLSGLINRDTKEEIEMFYLFEHPPILDGSKWRKTFGDPPTTPYEKGIRQTVHWWKGEDADE